MAIGRVPVNAVVVNGVPASDVTLGATLNSAAVIAADLFVSTSAVGSSASSRASIAVDLQPGRLVELTTRSAITAALRVPRLMAAAPAASAVSTASLSTAIRLAARGVSGASLEVISPGAASLAASPRGASSATGQLQTAITLRAAPQACASINGVLGTAPAHMSCSPSASPSLSAALATRLELSALPSGRSVAAGGLASAIRLSVSAVAVPGIYARMTTNAQEDLCGVVFPFTAPRLSFVREAA